MSVVATAALDRDFAQKGTITARPGQGVQLLGEDVIGWSAVLWSIRSYPETFEIQGGWTLNAETGAYESTAIRPAAFQLPGGEAGKYDIDLTVDGVTDSSLRIVVPSTAIGLVDTALGESTTRSGFRGFVRDINRNWRKLDKALSQRATVSASGDGGIKTIQAVTATPGWYVVGSFVPSAGKNVVLRVVGCVSRAGLTMRGRLFDATAVPGAPSTQTLSITSTSPLSAVSAGITVVADHLYQMQVEVTGGSASTDLGVVHLAQPVG